MLTILCLSMSHSSSSAERWFYTLSSVLLLVIAVIGFRYFYLEGKAYPGRPLTPPIRQLLVAHGIMMTLWMLLAVVQPFLVAAGNKRAHMKLGICGVLLAAGMVFAGLRVGIEATRVNPPEMQLFGLTMKQFMAIPVIGILTFGFFVFVGVWNRRRPAIHRPMMLMASVSIVSAALGRIAVLNDWYAGTWLEHWFSANLIAVLIGALLLICKCAVAKRFDRWFAFGFVILVAASVATAIGAKTPVWNQIATYLLR